MKTYQIYGRLVDDRTTGSIATSLTVYIDEKNQWFASETGYEYTPVRIIAYANDEGGIRIVYGATPEEKNAGYGSPWDFLPYPGEIERTNMPVTIKI